MRIVSKANRYSHETILLYILLSNTRSQTPTPTHDHFDSVFFLSPLFIRNSLIYYIRNEYEREATSLNSPNYFCNARNVEVSSKRRKTPATICCSVLVLSSLRVDRYAMFCVFPAWVLLIIFPLPLMQYFSLFYHCYVFQMVCWAFGLLFLCLLVIFLFSSSSFSSSYSLFCLK